MIVGGIENLLLLFLRFLTIAVVVACGASRLRIPCAIATRLAGLGEGLLRLGQGHPAGFELTPDPCIVLCGFGPGSTAQDLVGRT